MDTKHEIIRQAKLQTFSKRKYSIYEKRIMNHIVKCMQLKNFITKENDIFGLFTIFTIAVEDVVRDDNYRQYYRALKSLRDHSVEWKSQNGGDTVMSLISDFELTKEGKRVHLRLMLKNEMRLFYYNQINYTKIMFELAYTVESVNSLRLYEILSKKAGTGDRWTVDIDELKAMLGMDGKYPNNNHFFKYVLTPARDTLFNLYKEGKSDLDFEYEGIKEGRAFAKVDFLIRKIDDEKTIKKIASMKLDEQFSYVVNTLQENDIDYNKWSQDIMLAMATKPKKIGQLAQAISDATAYVYAHKEDITDQKSYLAKSFHKACEEVFSN